ncbi:MAG TPA: DUF202 domain-containing protein [Lacipirellulaceae bacterium]|nr:DUF202 domain-containing protein [Lacipirellulaceae bacterium]
MSPPPDDAALRDHLAVVRTRLANERTVLAYVRTAVMLIVAGATAIKLFGDAPLAVYSGWTFVAAGLATAGLGARRFAAVRRALGDEA